MCKLTATMSVRTERLEQAGPQLAPGHADVVATIQAAQASDTPLDQANEYNVVSPDNPLKRTIVVTVRASLDDLCLRKAKATWAPTADALRQVFQQTRFTDLQGTSETSGDLKSIVLHEIKMRNVKSTFPIPLGANITGVDSSCFSITGESFSAIVLPESDVNVTQTLQKDDISLAYEFARKVC